MNLILPQDDEWNDYRIFAKGFHPGVLTERFFLMKPTILPAEVWPCLD
jgi:hypothetical protein